MRDMLDSGDPYPLTAWTAQFQRIREDLDDALKLEEQVAVAGQTPEQRQYLGNSMTQFWDAVERMFALAQSGKDKEARETDTAFSTGTPGESQQCRRAIAGAEQ